MCGGEHGPFADHGLRSLPERLIPSRRKMGLHNRPCMDLAVLRHITRERRDDLDTTMACQDICDYPMWVDALAMVVAMWEPRRGRVAVRALAPPRMWEPRRGRRRACLRGRDHDPRVTFLRTIVNARDGCQLVGNGYGCSCLGSLHGGVFGKTPTAESLAIKAKSRVFRERALLPREIGDGPATPAEYMQPDEPEDA